MLSFSWDSYCSFVRSVESCDAVLSSLFSNDQHNTVVQGKYIAATSWLCALLDNTTVDNVYVHLDIKVSQEWLTDWTRTMSYKQIISWKRLLCFPVSHWLKFNDSVWDSACDWLALSPLHHLITKQWTTQWQVWKNERKNEREVKCGIRTVPSNWFTPKRSTFIWHHAPKTVVIAERKEATLKQRKHYFKRPKKWLVSLSEFETFSPITFGKCKRATWLN